MNTLKELNKIADELNSIPEHRPVPKKNHYDILNRGNYYEVYDNYVGIVMASGLTLEKAQYVFDILNRVKGR